MNLGHVRNLALAPILHAYDGRDSALYALSLGMGDDPLDEDELPYVYEGRGGLAVPSLCVTLGWPPLWHRAPETGIVWRRILHGEQSFRLHGPLTNAGRVRAEPRIVAAQDKGATRGAVLYTARDLFDADSGAPIAALRAAEFLRDDGGAGGFGEPLRLTPPLDGKRKPDAVVDYRTSAAAALLYRQASRDYMPIHADPDIARAAGFARPISHGLLTFGLAARAALKTYAPRQPQRIAAMAARFSAPAYPGDTIRVELFEAAGSLRFRAIALERGALTLDRGEIELR